MRTRIAIGLAALTVVCTSASVARAIIDPWPSQPTRPSTPVPPHQQGTPPTREIRDTLRALDPVLAQCAQSLPRARRVRVRVFVYPTGTWSMDIPELATPSDADDARLAQCIREAVATRVVPSIRPFQGRGRIKIERAYALRPPGPPPPTARLRAIVLRRRAAIQACIPGSGRGPRTNVVVRATLASNGTFELTGLELPPGAPFDTVAACVRSALAAEQHAPVTASATFEATISVRWQAPDAAPPL